MKKLLFSLLIAFAGRSVAIEQIQTADQITYDWLVELGQSTSYTDHIPHFQKLFKRMKVRGFLEFGVGFSTKYFLDSCDKVISVEFVTNGYGPEWMKSMLDLYRDYSNWIPLVYFTGYQGETGWAPYKYLGSESVYKAASYQTGIHKSFALIDNFYLTELNIFIANTIRNNKIDVAFVDPGMYLRGDLVQLLFGKVEVILAHDTAVRALRVEDDVYGYTRVVAPQDYEEIYLQYGQGTTVWILKNDKNKRFIEEMKTYAEGL